MQGLNENDVAKVKKSSLAALFPELFSFQLMVSDWQVVCCFFYFMNECKRFAEREVSAWMLWSSDFSDR